MKYSKRTLPMIPVGHPDYVWKSHADVQATWRRYGWTPPTGQHAMPVLREMVSPAWVPMQQVRRVK
jgi:hypothetical protein